MRGKSEGLSEPEVRKRSARANRRRESERRQIPAMMTRGLTSDCLTGLIHVTAILAGTGGK